MRFDVGTKRSILIEFLSFPIVFFLQSQFEERICMVKSGAFLNTISKVEISELQPPLDLLSVSNSYE